MPTHSVTISVPEEVLLAENATPEGFGAELALLAAVKLYELGRLSSGRASALAGMPRVAFLHALGRYRVSPLAAEADDLDASIEAGHFASASAHPTGPT
ncbi:MAG: UPF0175 family protein [Bacteroidota bacterium]